MVDVQYFPISAIQPIELHYQFSVDEQLNVTSKNNAYAEGINFFTVDGLNNYQDTVFNSYSNLTLTSAVSLSSLFAPKTTNRKIPYVCQIQNEENSFLYYDVANNVVTLSSVPSFIVLFPILSSNNYNVIADGYYLYADADTSSTLRGTTVASDAGIFTIDFRENSIITLNTSTAYGNGYAAALNGNYCALGSPLNNYLLSSIPLGDQFIYDYVPNNQWVTYFMNFFLKESKDVTLNKVLNDVKINYLLDFPYLAAAENNKAYINISNLKTGYTPQGYPVPVDNFYIPQVALTVPEVKEALALALGLDPLYFANEELVFSL
jgi:hypothetical protein